MAGEYKLMFKALEGSPDAAAELGRNIYTEALRDMREDRPELRTFDIGNGQQDDALSLAQDAVLEKARRRGVRVDVEQDEEPDPLPPDLAAEFQAITDYSREARGEQVDRGAYALRFSEAARAYLASRKGTMTQQTTAQHEAVYRLFAGFIGDKAFARVGRGDVVRFLDEVREFDPDWGRSPKTKGRSWNALKALYQGKGKRLTDKTLVRYMSHFIPLWDWAEKREEVRGTNPFRKLVKKPRKKAGTYIPFDIDELNKLFAKVPRRAWLWEVAVVALYSGMRANEICSLEWSDIKKGEGGVWYFDITEAKSEAGVRQVPVHSKLSWLLSRRPKKPAGQVWPALKPGGPDKKHSHYYSGQFTAWRRDVGLVDDRKVFHSLRKCAVECLDRAGVRETDAAQIVGHERKGITFGTYAPRGMTLPQKQEVVELIKYVALKLPRPLR